MMKPTPGPWALRGYQIRADDGRGQHIASYQTNAADGALMAAAPELLDAAKGADGFLSMIMEGRGLAPTQIKEISDLRAAITKATMVPR